MLGFYTMGIPENLSAVRKRVFEAAVRSGRDPRNVKLVAVTKTVSLPEIIAAAHAGAVIFGENRVQEAQRKIADYRAQLPDMRTEWHLVGHLQKNKARPAVRLFDLIHSVDSGELAEALNRCCQQAGKVQRVLIQVKLADEATKHGAPESSILQLLREMNGMPGLRPVGLMTITPYFDDPEMSRPYYRRLRELRDELRTKGIELTELSMGMSHDFEVAVEEGATFVRIGTAIFGERN